MPSPRFKGSAGKRKSAETIGKQLSTRTKKQIDSLPKHAQLIYNKVHANAIEQYQNS